MANINDRINGQEFESASPLAHAVRYDRAQVKTEEQKKQARENIGCYCEAGGGGGGGSGFNPFIVNTVFDENMSRSLDKTAGEITAALREGPVVLLEKAIEGENILVDYGFLLGSYHVPEENEPPYEFQFKNSMFRQGITHFYAFNANDYPNENI